MSKVKKSWVRSQCTMVTIGALTLAGCGGGSTSDTPPTGRPEASLVTQFSGKTPWNLATTAQVSLKDTSGTTVSGALTCSSDSPTALIVTADCSSITGKRLGNQTLTVSGGGVSAKATVKVIPQPQPLASHGAASSNGSGQFNFVTTTDGRVLAWGARHC